MKQTSSRNDVKRSEGRHLYVHHKPEVVLAETVIGLFKTEEIYRQGPLEGARRRRVRDPSQVGLSWTGLEADFAWDMSDEDIPEP
jgi:hypothetical protein